MTHDDLKKHFRALHMICRFNGNVTRHYSVAEHTAIGLECMERDKQPLDLMRGFLVHDLPEAILGLGDLRRGVKDDPAIAAIVEPREIECWNRVDLLLGYEIGTMARLARDPVVKSYDRLMSVAEVQAVACVPHDSPDDFQPYVHGYACRRIREGAGPIPTPRLDRWVRSLLGVDVS